MPSGAPTLSKWLPSSATEFAPAPGVRPRVPYLWNEKLYGTLVSVGVYQADYAEMRYALPMGDTMDITTLLIIVVVILLLGGGGWYGRGRWW